MVRSEQNKQWDEVIGPADGLFKLNLKEVLRYSDLILLFVRRDFVANYKQTILGPAWFFIQPILSTITFTIVFGKVAQIPTNGIPPLLFYLGGLTLWNYFSQSLMLSSNTFISNQGIFGKVYFPRLVVPVSSTLSSLIKLGLQLLLFTVVWLYYWVVLEAVEPNAIAFLLPVLIVITAFSSLGLGILISSLTTKYRDFKFLLGFGVQLLMYASPIIYPLSVVPEQYRWILILNPMSTVIETFKYGFFGNGLLLWGGLLYSTVFSLVIILISIVVFNKTEKGFMDTV